MPVSSQPHTPRTKKTPENLYVSVLLLPNLGGVLVHVETANGRLEVVHVARFVVPPAERWRRGLLLEGQALEGALHGREGLPEVPDRRPWSLLSARDLSSDGGLVELRSGSLGCLAHGLAAPVLSGRPLQAERRVLESAPGFPCQH